MAYTANCTLVGQTYNNSAWGSYNPGQACWAGNDQGDSCTTIIKFTTPSFTGRSTRLTVSFPTKHISGYYNSQWPDIRYALCSSDANKAAYRNTTSAVSDPYQIASGYKEITAGDPVTLTFDTSVLKPNTSYYVYIWGGDSYSKFQIDIYPSATLTYVKTFTVTYNANGVGDAPAAVTVDEGSSIALPSLSASGYDFLGWDTSPDATSGITGTYKPTASVTLYAVWERASCAVIYKYGAEEISDEKRNGEAITLRGASFYRRGYTQIGWSTSEGGALTHALGAIYEADEALTLYPVWGIAPGVVLWLLIARLSRGRLKSSGEINTSAVLGEAILGTMVLGQE